MRVLITGSNRGIGRETARHFARAGAQVAINGRDAGRLESVRAELSEAGYSVISIAGDISDPEQSATIVETAVSRLGGLDVLVNNAALAMRGRFEDLAAPVVDRILRVNVSGSVMTTVHALPALRESRGSVIFVSSLAGLWGFPLISVYSASKMALTAIAQSLRSELAGTGVHVGVLHVGVTQHDADKAILATDGAPYPLAPRPRADTQAHVARVVFGMVRRRQKRRILTPAGHALSIAARVFPRIFALLVGRASARVERIAR